MDLNKYLDVSPEVAEALARGKPVVALESTIISHGMPYPQNVETARKVEQTIRDEGATPATIAVLGGRMKAGLSDDELEYLGKAGQKVTKASRRDLPVLVAKGMDALALRIVKIAEENGVYVTENRALARELYETVDLGQQIPGKLFNAVATILTEMYTAKGMLSGVTEQTDRMRAEKMNNE